MSEPRRPLPAVPAVGSEERESVDGQGDGQRRAAVADVGDGAVLAVGGFGLCGVPYVLIDPFREQGKRDLATISNNCGVRDEALGVLLYRGRIRKTISSFVGGSKERGRPPPSRR